MVRLCLICVVLLTFPASIQAQFTFTTNSGAITITGYTGPGGVLTIPSTIDEKPVVGIGVRAFAYNGNLTGITIPDTVLEIGAYAFFYCTNLITVKMGQSVTSIQYAAFADCFKLRSITIPTNTTYIGNAAFCNIYVLTSIRIPDGISSIGDYVFSGCKGLVNVTIPGSVTSIGTEAFRGCDNLQGVYFGGAAPTYRSWAFDMDYKATAYYLPGTSNWVATFAGLPAVCVSNFYYLAIDGGSGSGSYTNQQQVVITADPPGIGKVFDQWIGNTQDIASATSSPTILTMPPHAIALTATYKDTRYTLTVNGGTGGGLYTNGQLVLIYANDAPLGIQEFYQWEGDTQFVASVASKATTVLMPARDVTLTAAYTNLYFLLTVNEGIGSGLYYFQQEVFITANPPPTGKTFERWIGDTQYVIATNSAATQVIMPATPISLTATYTNLYYTLTIDGGSGGGTYTYGTAVPISASNAPAGQVFDQWIGDTQYVTSVTSTNTTVMMPAQAIRLAASYRTVFYELTVHGGTGGGDYTNGTLVTITAAPPALGQAFDRWVGDTQYVADAAAATTTMTMPDRKVTLTATYKDASIVAWGQNDYGQTTVPAGLSNVVAIAGGGFHSLALRADGMVAAWGDNYWGQTNVPAGLSNVVAVAAGGWHSLAVNADGIVFAWGRNDYSQRGVPVGLSNVVAVAAGYSHSLALRADGTVVAWGDNYWGQTIVPMGLSNVVAIAAGGMHNLALRADGSIAAWGYGGTGQTGIPVGLTNVMQIGGGYGHNLALCADGSLVSWGYNLWGQANIPAGLSNVVAVAASEYHNLALKSDGTVAAWGRADYDDTTVPVGLSNVVTVTAGAYHNLALIGTGRPVLNPMVNQVHTQLGNPVFLQARATGERPLSYQWQNNGVPLAGATNKWLRLMATNMNQSGGYAPVVSNAQGVMTGAVVQVIFWTDDSDNDGLPDSWETQYFGGATNANPDAICANGINTVWQAFVAGFSPTNPKDGFNIIGYVRSQQNELCWNAVTDRVYSIYWATNLHDRFQLLETNIMTGSYTDSVHTGGNVFYRLEVHKP